MGDQQKLKTHPEMPGRRYCTRDRGVGLGDLARGEPADHLKRGELLLIDIEAMRDKSRPALEDGRLVHV